MKIKKIPNLSGYPSPISYLTPSQFTKVTDGCYYAYLLDKALREATPNNEKVRYNLPPNSNSIHGTIIHKLLQKRVEGEISIDEEFEEMWENAIQETENKLSEEYPTVIFKNLVDYTKMYEAEEFIMNIPALYHQVDEKVEHEDVGTCSEREKTTEVCMSIKDCLLGYIDRIRKTQGQIQIIDYKTGGVLDENGVVKKIYQDQLNLYGLLYQFNKNEEVDKLLIIDTQGREYEVPKSDKIYSHYIDEIKKKIFEINTHINNGTIDELARPGQDGFNCKLCNVRHVCKRNSFVPSDNFNHIITGVVTDVSDSKRNSIDLLLSNGTSVKIVDLARLNIQDFNILSDKTLLFTNLIKYENRVNTYKFSDSSQVFEQNITKDYGCIENFLPELADFLKWLIDNNKQFDKKGNYTILDEDGDVVAEAGIGWKDKKIVAIPLDFASEQYFRKKQYTVFGENELETIKQYL